VMDGHDQQQQGHSAQQQLDAATIEQPGGWGAPQRAHQQQQF
jgi:hypothetical protein